MKTVTTIHLNGRAYQVEDEAHKALAAYLDRAAAALAHNPDKEEILADFETAMAEKFARYLSPNKNVLTKKEVDTIIGEMGPVEGADSEPSASSAENDSAATSKPKRLYRDPDNRVIAGVASGLAQYFGIDPVIMRIIFLISVFIGGTGFAVYIVLWLVVPEAESTAQKLEMRGDDVTLSSMADVLKKKVQEIKRPETKTAFEKILAIPVKILRAIGSLIQKGILPIFRTLFGVVFMCVGFVGAVGTTIAAGLALFATPAGVSDLPLITANAGPSFYIALIAGYVAIVIPFAAIFFAGLGIMEKKRQLRGKIGVSFLVLWFLAIIVAGVTGTRSVLDVRHSMMNDSSFQTTTKVIPLEAFTKLSVANGQNVTYIAGDTYSVTTEGRKRDMENLFIVNADDTLTIEERQNFSHGCFIFCLGKERVLITVTAPTIENIALANGSKFKGLLAGKDLVMSLKNASRADITWNGASSHFSLENASVIDIDGNTDALSIVLKNASRYEGAMLTAKNVEISAENASRAEIGTSETLSVLAQNGSHIEYSGTPKIEKNLKNGSSLEVINEE